MLSKATITSFLILFAISISSCSTNNHWPLFLARENGKYGYINNEGQWIIHPRFKKATYFHNGIAMANPESVSNRFIITSNGNVFRTHNFFRMENLHNHHFNGLIYDTIATKTNVTFHIDMPKISKELRLLIFGKEKKRLLRVQFHDLKNKLIRYTGFSDSTGRIVMSMKIWKGTITSSGFKFPFSDGLTACEIGISSQRDTRTIFFDKSGNRPFQKQLFWAGGFKEGLAAYLDIRNGKYGFINKNGNILIKPKYFSANQFNSGLACVSLNGKVQIHDNHEFYKYRTFTYLAYPKKIIFIDRSGKQAIKVIYQDAKSFSEGLAPVRIHQDEWQYIDKAGRVVLQGEWDDADPFKNGLALVKVWKRKQRYYWMYINRQGRVVWKEDQ